MHTRKLALALGALLSAGMLMAQAPDQTQSTPPAQTQAPAGQTQAEGPHGHHRNRQLHEMKKKLNLSNEQVAQIKPIIADRRQQMQSLRANTSLNDQDRRAKMQGIAQDSRAKIEAVLNDQQKQQFEQMLAQRRARRQQQPPQG
jgi:protein CpxP